MIGFRADNCLYICKFTISIIKNVTSLYCNSYSYFSTFIEIGPFKPRSFWFPFNTCLAALCPISSSRTNRERLNHVFQTKDTPE